MQMKTDYKVTIGQHFLCALVNNDYSGMTEEDAEQLNDFLKRNNYGHVICPFDIPESDFRRCEISGLKDNCVDVEFYIIER